MKGQTIIPLLSIFLIQLISTTAFAQCKSFIKKTDLSMMEEYDYCGRMMSTSMYSEDSAEVAIRLHAKKKYQIMISAQEYLGRPGLEVKKKNEELPIWASTDGKSYYWEVFPEENSKVILKVKFEKRKQFAQGIKASGCVLLLIGEMGLEELVDNP